MVSQWCVEMFSFPATLSFVLLWIFIASDNIVDDSHLSIFVQDSYTYQKKLQEIISTFEKVLGIFKDCFIFISEFQSFSEFPGKPLVESHQCGY